MGEGEADLPETCPRGCHTPRDRHPLVGRCGASSCSLRVLRVRHGSGPRSPVTRQLECLTHAHTAPHAGSRQGGHDCSRSGHYSIIFHSFHSLSRAYLYNKALVCACSLWVQKKKKNERTKIPTQKMGMNNFKKVE